MKKRNVLSWLAILSITMAALSGCNSGGDSSVSNSNSGSVNDNGSVIIPVVPETPVNPELPIEPATLSSIVVTADVYTPRVAKGEEVKLFATAVYSDGSHETVTENVEWITDTPNILTVSEKGEVSTRPDADAGTGADVGTGIVVAQFEGIESEPFKIEITQPELTGIVVDPRTRSVASGFNVQLSAWGLYTDNVPRDITTLVTWYTSNENVLTVGEYGLASGRETGVSEVQAGLGRYYSPLVPVEVTEAELQNITITPNKFTLPLGTEQKLVVTGHFSDGSVADITKDVTWKDSTDNVVDLHNGVFVATHQETVTLVAEYDDVLQAEVTIEVTDAVVGQIEVSPSNATIAKGNNQAFKATAVYTNGEKKDVTKDVKWESGDYRLLTLKDNVASGHNAGKTTVVASLGDVKSAFVPVSVTAAKLTGLTITPSHATLEKYNVKRFHAVGHYSDGSSNDITELVSWSSNDKDTVALMKDGISNGLELGETTISATKDGVSATASVEVVATSDAATNIQVCGTGVDDKDRTNATDACLKVASGDNGFWYTSPPSINLMNGLGYKWVHALSPEAQQPKTYNYVRVEPGSHGPAGEFAMFNNYGLERQGKTGQWALWCEELNEKQFAGRTNWRRATMGEMFSLYRKVGGSLWNGENKGTIVGEGLGWPTSFDYWTMTSGHQDYVPYEGYYDLVNMKNATSWLVGHLADPAYASCVSEPSVEKQ